MSTIDMRALLGAPKHANQHRLSRLTMEAHTDELRVLASEVEAYTDELIAALEAADKRVTELEAALNRLYSQCDTGFRRGNGSQEGVAMPSWVVVEETRLLLGVK